MTSYYRKTNRRGGNDREEEEEAAYTVKVVLLGDSGVGKSSLALRFVNNEFKPYNESTIGASFMSKTVLVPSSPPPQQSSASIVDAASCIDTTTSDIHDEQKNETTASASSSPPPPPPPPPKRIAFKIWDTAGQEKYAALAPMYYRGAGAAVLTYDICKAQSFDVLKRWVHELSHNGPPNIVLAVCGNKFDLADRYREVDADIARQYAESIGASFFEASAKEAINVQVIFHDLARRLPDPDTFGVDAELLAAEAGGGRSGRVDIASLAPPVKSNWIAYC